MSAVTSGRISANKVGAVLAVLLLVWLAIVVWPRLRRQQPPNVPMVARVESKLNAVGLADNVDWQGLPEFFAVWANDAPWEQNRTKFAYWSEATRAYAYLFEATRVDGGYRFRLLDPREAFADADRALELELLSEMTENMTARHEGSPHHPFVFLPLSRLLGVGQRVSAASPKSGPAAARSAPTVQVDLKPETLSVPKTMPNLPFPDGPKAK